MKMIIDSSKITLKQFLIQSGNIQYNGKERFFYFPDLFFKDISGGNPDQDGWMEMMTPDELPEWVKERLTEE